MVDKIKADRKRRRYEKVINKLEKFKLQLKPIHEYEPERRILKELEYVCPIRWSDCHLMCIFPLDSVRKRPPADISPEETTQRLMLNREWAKYKYRQHQEEMNFISRALKSQENALQELKLESEQLYEQAIQVSVSSNCWERIVMIFHFNFQADQKLIPFVRRGPLYSLPNPNYDAPDGDYFDTTNYFTKGFGVNFMEHMKNMERQKWTELRAERRAKKEEKDD